MPTLERLLSRVDSPVIGQVPLGAKLLRAEVTRKGKLAAVSPQVNLKVKKIQSCLILNNNSWVNINYGTNVEEGRLLSTT